jgi:hypothetical protein
MLKDSKNFPRLLHIAQTQFVCKFLQPLCLQSLKFQIVDNIYVKKTSVGDIWSVFHLVHLVVKSFKCLKMALILLTFLLLCISMRFSLLLTIKYIAMVINLSNP